MNEFGLEHLIVHIDIWNMILDSLGTSIVTLINLTRVCKYLNKIGLARKCLDFYPLRTHPKLTKDKLNHFINKTLENATQLKWLSLPPDYPLTANLHWETLEEIYFKSSDRMNASGLKTLVQNARNIKHISFQGCRKVNSNSISLLCVPHFTSLESLNLKGCFLDTPESIIHVLQHFKNLASLTLASIPTFNSNVFSKVNLNLKYLDLKGCNGLKEDKNCLNVFAEWCPQLEELHLSLTNFLPHSEPFSSFEKPMPNLKILHLQKIPALNKEGISNICRLCKNIEYFNLIDNGHLPNQAFLNLSYLEKLKVVELKNCVNIDDDSMIEIFNNCVQLEILNCDGNHLITDKSIIACTASPQAKYKRILNFRLCHRISNQGLKLITENCVQVKTLILDGCKDINVEHLIQLIIQRKDSLSYLNVKGLELEDRFLDTISQYSPFMKKVDIQATRLKAQSIAHFCTLNPNIIVRQ